MSRKPQEVLIKERKKRDMSQRQVADELGISKYTYINIEQGITKPRWETGLSLAEFFEIDPFEINYEKKG
jgi:DNA-binding XRE family transcriptional regulator